VNNTPQGTLSKVPEVTLAFWIIKIAATTVGETGGDTVTMTLNWGYLAGTAFFLSLLIVLVVAQVLAKKFQPFLYWATIVASTTFGTTMADFTDRSLAIGYAGGSTLLFLCLMAVLVLWYWSQGTISVNAVSTPNASIGPPSPSRRRSAPRLAIGWPIPEASATKAAHSCSLRGSLSLSGSTCGHACRACFFSGQLSSSPGRLALP
jgi:hypothetical protein